MSKILLIESFIVVISYVILHYIIRNYVNNSLKNKHLNRGRRKMIIKALQLLVFLAGTIFLSAIWGLKQNQIAVFAGTILTALGVAFFAQWSLLSNISSSLLLFFNHPMKIGDTIKVMDKDFPFEGVVSDLTYFFVLLELENGEKVTIPNSLFFQKSICVIDQVEPK